jgi:hypothetical protein
MPIAKSPLIYILVGVIAPSAIMLGARIIGEGPKESIAQSIPNYASEIVPYTDNEAIGSENANVETERVVVQSPFWFEDTQYNPFIDSSDFQQVTQPENDVSIAQVHVTSILPHPTNPLAIINSKPCKIGDDITAEWKLIGINGNARTVTLVNSSGKEITVGLIKRP